MKGLIVYKSKYGAAGQYAAWLSNELRLPLMQADDCDEDDIEESNFIIIGSSVYIGKLLIRKWLLQNAFALQKKKLFLFVVCGTEPDEKEKLESYISSSVPGHLRSQCQVYFLPGKMVYKKLSWTDKFMLQIGARLSKEPGAKQKMLTDYNAVKKENLDAILKDIKTYAGPRREVASL
ncbi:MAG TPA: flavodoxin domain-containing protein [Chitinophagaceae bacterium]